MWNARISNDKQSIIGGSSPYLFHSGDLISILYVHEYDLHGLRDMEAEDHPQLYFMQSKHPSFKFVTPAYKKHVLIWAKLWSE